MEQEAFNNLFGTKGSNKSYKLVHRKPEFMLIVASYTSHIERGDKLVGYAG